MKEKFRVDHTPSFFFIAIYIYIYRIYIGSHFEFCCYLAEYSPNWPISKCFKVEESGIDELHK